MLRVHLRVEVHKQVYDLRNLVHLLPACQRASYLSDFGDFLVFILLDNLQGTTPCPHESIRGHEVWKFDICTLHNNHVSVFAA